MICKLIVFTLMNVLQFEFHCILFECSFDLFSMIQLSYLDVYMFHDLVLDAHFNWLDGFEKLLNFNSGFQTLIQLVSIEYGRIYMITSLQSFVA